MLSGRTRLLCLIGDPVAHSASPLMYNTAFEELGLEYAFMCFRSNIEELPETVAALKRLNVRGFSCTMPVKMAMCDYVDELTPAAELMQAVNCVSIEEDGRLVGHNTDGRGYIDALKSKGVDIVGKKITLIGGGGAATAIAVQLALDGAKELRIFNRPGKSFDRASVLADKLNEQTDCEVVACDSTDSASLRASIADSYLLCNGTSVGMAPNVDQSPITDSSMLHPDLIVSDVIYNPMETKLIKDAKASGCEAYGGYDMLLYQGVVAFKIWTGEDMPLEVVKEALNK